MRLDCAAAEELIWDFARDGVPLTEAAFRHIEQCKSCAQALAEVEASLEALAFVKPSPAAPDCRRRVAERVRARQVVPAYRRLAWAAVPAAVAALLLTLLYLGGPRKDTPRQPVAQRRAPRHVGKPVPPPTPTKPELESDRRPAPVQVALAPATPTQRAVTRRVERTAPADAKEAEQVLAEVRLVEGRPLTLAWSWGDDDQDETRYPPDLSWKIGREPVRTGKGLSDVEGRTTELPAEGEAVGKGVTLTADLQAAYGCGAGSRDGITGATPQPGDSPVAEDTLSVGCTLSPTESLPEEDRVVKAVSVSWSAESDPSRFSYQYSETDDTTGVVTTGCVRRDGNTIEIQLESTPAADAPPIKGGIENETNPCA